jgi:hypothetical protein
MTQKHRLFGLATAFVFSVAALQAVTFSWMAASAGFEPTIGTLELMQVEATGPLAPNRAAEIPMIYTSSEPSIGVAQPADVFIDAPAADARMMRVADPMALPLPVMVAPVVVEPISNGVTVDAAPLVAPVPVVIDAATSAPAVIETQTASSLAAEPEAEGGWFDFLWDWFTW